MAVLDRVEQARNFRTRRPIEKMSPDEVHYVLARCRQLAKQRRRKAAASWLLEFERAWRLGRA